MENLKPTNLLDHNNIKGFNGKRFTILEKIDKNFKVKDNYTNKIKILNKQRLIRDDNRSCKFPWYDRKLDNSYYNMMDRCNNKYNPNYPFYGGAGIKVEDLSNPLIFQEFALSIKGLWTPGFEIHRINSKGNYNTDNCIFLNPVYHTKYSKSIIIRIYNENLNKYDTNKEYYGTLRDWNTKMHVGHGFLSNKFKSDINSMNEYVLWKFKEFFPKEKGWKVDNLNPIDYREKCVEINLGLHLNILNTSSNMQIPDIYPEKSYSYRYVENLPLQEKFNIKKTESWWSKFLGYNNDYIGNKFRNIQFDFERQLLVREFIINELIEKYPEMIKI